MKPLAALGLICITGILLAQPGSYITFFLGTSSGNPTSGSIRVWGNTATGNLECLTSSGGACLPTIVASGQTAMATSSVSANTCTSGTTASATNALTTDSAELTYASDPTGVTGYGAGTSGGITIRTWLTANTINFKECNETGSSITPGALSLNWRIIR